MKYDFTSIMFRSGHGAIAIDGLGSMPGFASERPNGSKGIQPITKYRMENHHAKKQPLKSNRFFNIYPAASPLFM